MTRWKWKGGERQSGVFFEFGLSENGGLRWVGLNFKIGTKLKSGIESEV